MAAFQAFDHLHDISIAHVFFLLSFIQNNVMVSPG
jgi:hypothetical protein